MNSSQPAAYKVPRNRKRDYLTTEERERKAERAAMDAAELMLRAEQAAQAARLGGRETKTRADFAAVADWRRDAAANVSDAWQRLGHVTR